jgi:sulfite reductase (NADPH) hemoprotein beta-component
LGRTPILGVQIREGLPWQHLLSYVEAILRVYNRHGRRDNKYKARIKILVKALGIEAFAKEVEEEWQHLKDGPAQLTEAEYARVASAFVRRSITPWPTPIWIWHASGESPAFARWVARNVQPHKVRVTPAWCCRPNRA